MHHPAFLARLRESGLSTEDARKLGLRVLTPQQTFKRGFSKTPRLALEIPYHDSKGKAIGFSRVRFLDAPGGFLAAAKKPRRYSQTPDSGVHIYFPRTARWDFLFSPPTEDKPGDLLITEGEFKAACAVRFGFPTLGLGGVWSFRDKTSLFLPALEKILWKDRRVYIVYDSDVRTKEPVRLALLHLCHQLFQRGAQPFEVMLDLSSSEKVGLDDFLVAKGPRAFAACMEAAKEYEISRVLQAEGWGDRFVLVGDQTAVFDRKKALFHGLNDFHQLYQDVTAPMMTPSQGGVLKLKASPLTKAWMRWPLKLRADTLDIIPNQPAFVHQDQRIVLNQWRGWGVPSIKGPVGPWKKLLHGLFDDPDKERLVERWCAYQVQHPGQKITWAVLIWDTLSGTGKSFLGYIFGGIFGDGFQELKAEELYTDFNGHLHGKQFLMVEEVGKSEKRRESAYLKTAISRQTILVNEKYMRTFRVPDRCNYYLTTNEADPVNIDSFDRRLFIHQVKTRRLPPDWLRGELHRWASNGKRPLFRGRGISHLRYYLEHEVDVRDFNPFAEPPFTEDKHQMVRLSARGVDAWIIELLADRDRLDRDLYTAQELAIRCNSDMNEPVGAHLMARGLKRQGCHTVNGGRTCNFHEHATTLWCLRRVEYWIKQPHAVIQKYMEEKCPQRWREKKT